MALDWKRAGPGKMDSPVGQIRRDRYGHWYFRHTMLDIEMGPFDTASNAKRAVELLSKSTRVNHVR